MIGINAKVENGRKKYDKKHLARSRERDRKRYHSDPQFRTKKILRTRLKKVLKGEKMYTRILNYVGCDWNFLRCWFEYQFQFDDKLTWKNQGSYWNIDHVVPCNSFDLTKEKNKYKCFHWRNLRPLCASDDRNKWKHIIPDVIKKHKQIVIDFENFYLFGTK